MTFNELNIGDYFEFVHKSTVGGGMFNLVGLKKDEFSYRMAGLNRMVGNGAVRVIKRQENQFGLDLSKNKA